MRHKALKFVMAILIVAIGGYGVHLFRVNQMVVSEVALADLEALANDIETDQSCGRYCYKNDTDLCKKLGDWGFCVGKKKTI